MLVSDVIIRVRRVFGDEAAVQVTDEDIIRWINDGQIEIIKHNEGALQKTAFIDLVANQSTYTLPADLMLLRSLRYKYVDMVSYSNLKYQSMQQFDESVDGWDGTLYNSAKPQFYTVYENKAILFPTPDQGLVSGIKVLYNQVPAVVTTTSDSMALPLIYFNTIVRYCMWQASLLDEDLDPATMYRADFQADSNLLVTREQSEAIASYPVITIRDEDQ
jgi:uncharacterized protein DUF6682